MKFKVWFWTFLFLLLGVLLVSATTISDVTSIFTGNINGRLNDLFNFSDLNATRATVTTISDGVLTVSGGNITGAGDINGTTFNVTRGCIGANCVTSWSGWDRVPTDEVLLNGSRRMTGNLNLGTQDLYNVSDVNTTRSTSVNYCIGTACFSSFAEINTTSGEIGSWGFYSHKYNVSAGGFYNTESNLTSLLDDNYLVNGSSANFLRINGTEIFEGGVGVATVNDLTVGNVTVTSLVKVKNEAGATANKSNAMHFSGYNSGTGRISVVFANNTGKGGLAHCLMLSDVADNGNGQCVVHGLLNQTDTSSWATDDDVYLNSSVGTLTNVTPSTANCIQKLGVVLRSHVSQGAIFVHGAGRCNDVPSTINVTGNLTTNTNLCIGAVCISNYLEVNKTYTTSDWYLGVSGLTLTFNQVRLNATIQALSDLDTDTHVKGDGVYLTNDSTTMTFSEAKLNATIDARENDTTIGNCSVDQSCPNVLYDTNATNFVSSSAYTNLLLENGSNALTSNWDVGSFGLNGTYFEASSHLCVGANCISNYLEVNKTYTTSDWYLGVSGLTLTFDQTKLNNTVKAISVELTDNFVGDVTGTYDATVVGDDSHNHTFSTVSVKAENVSSGTFGTGNFVFGTNVTYENIKPEGNTSFYEYANSTCWIRVVGATRWEVCV